MSDEWGPWIDHDGGPCRLKVSAHIEIVFDSTDYGLLPDRVTDDATPNWLWRWKTVRTGWFKSERKRICDDHAYAPIIAYRIRKGNGLVILESLLENPPEEVDV